MKNETMAEFYRDKILEILDSKLDNIEELCDGIDDHCEQILDDVDLLNTLSLVREIKEYCYEIHKITDELKNGGLK